MRYLSQLLLAACLTSFHAFAAGDAGDAPHYPAGRDYDQIDASLDGARDRAIDENKLLMVVLGADWCHDSRAFIDHLGDPAFAALIETRYVVERVNVGYFDYVRGVVDRWDIPVIYGTPTVIVVEPASDTVLNRDSLSHWRSAASMEPAEAERYFDAFAPGPPPSPESPSPELAEALDDIERFERAQAERIYRAYAVLGAEMRGMGEERPSPEFMEKWDNLAAMRSSITTDLADLRASARAQDEAGASDIALSYPQYDLFID